MHLDEETAFNPSSGEFQRINKKFRFPGEKPPNIKKWILFFACLLLVVGGFEIFKTFRNTISKNQEQITDFSGNIREFLNAEDSRDFSMIYSFFSTKISRYWTINNPGFSDLKNQYERIWSFTSNARSQVINIIKVDEYSYILQTNFSYYDHRNNEQKSIKSTVYFGFDSRGKIVETYGIN